MAQQDGVLTSVGIDIGTTTTQIVVSQLTLSNVMPGSQVPKIEISNKSVLFVGSVYFTPFVDREHVDGRALRNIIATEYKRAGFSSADIDTGAIIITGETAKKENAAEIIHSLTEYAGDFVVATAGPDLESIIAGKGSGAEAISKAEHIRVVNIDVGGGTSNIAVFDSGKCIGTGCVNVGGRLIEIDELSHRIKYMAPAAKAAVAWLEKNGMSFDTSSMEGERALIDAVLAEMVEAVDRIVLKEQLREIDCALLMTDSLPELEHDAVVYSGGVARYIYQPGIENWWMHGDVGPLLADAFRKGRLYKGYEVMQGEETIHATVLGAGAHTINVSGSTIMVSKDSLPLRNLPAVRPDLVDADNPARRYSWVRNAENYSESIYKTVALVVPEMEETSFLAIKALAENIAQELPQIKGSPKVIISKQDIAKVLGQSLQGLVGDMPIVCLDAIDLHTGDYVDIAKPLPHQDAVPVIIKTLVFAG